MEALKVRMLQQQYIHITIGYGKIALVMDLPIILLPGEDGYIVAECPVIPGCISQGQTRDEALRNIRETIELCLENRLSEGWQLPDGYEIVQMFIEG